MSEGPLIFDHGVLRLRRRRALGQVSFLMQRVADDLGDRLATVLRHFGCAVDLGTPGDAVLDVLAASGKTGSIVAADALVTRKLMKPGVLGVAADEEALPFRDASLDLVVSALAFQFINDLPGLLVQLRRALKPDGLFLAALAGGETLIELRHSFAEAEIAIENGVSPRVIPLLDVREAGTLLQRAGFALPVTDVDRIIVRYDSPVALMHDLRALGATNPMVERSRRPLKRALLERMIDIYRQRFSDPDGRMRATFDIVWVSGWAPDPSSAEAAATRLCAPASRGRIGREGVSGRREGGRIRR